MRQLRTLYHIVRTTEKLPDPRTNSHSSVCEESHTYDKDEAEDQAFELAYREARLGYNVELSKVNTTPITYLLFYPASHTRVTYKVQSSDDGIEL